MAVRYDPGMAQWLVKEEPDHYNYDQLEQDKKTVWAGVRNPLAQKHLRSIKRGDRIFYYHTGKEKAVVATAKATSDAYPDPNDKSGKLSVVDIAPDKKLARAVTLAEIKSDKAFRVLSSRAHVAVVGDAGDRR
jgi:predicted RNA-binding protein with PUA-like domain